MSQTIEMTMADISDAPTDTVKSRDVVRAAPAAITTVSATPADLLMHAMNSGADLDRLERLMDMQIKWEQREAHKAYTAAMAEFKLNPPTIIKDKHVSFKTDKGVTQYDHATIGNVVEKIVAALAEHGFSHRWIPTRGEGGMMSITCVITHKLGHSEETTLEAGLDQSGGKNNIQAMISTKTYLERHSLLAATGLATKDQVDDDAHDAERRQDVQAAVNTWVAKAKAVKSPPELKIVWRDGLAAMEATNDMGAYREFKNAVESKTADFRAAADESK